MKRDNTSGRDWPPPTHDSLKAKAARLLYPDYSYCLRCGQPWQTVTPHSTNYATQFACFPLCETCWTELGTPNKRLPYYRTLADQWAKQGFERPGQWDQIEAAVNAGN